MSRDQRSTPLRAALKAATGAGLHLHAGDRSQPTRLHCRSCAASLAIAATPPRPARTARRVDVFIARHNPGHDSEGVS